MCKRDGHVLKLMTKRQGKKLKRESLREIRDALNVGAVFFDLYCDQVFS